MCVLCTLVMWDFKFGCCNVLLSSVSVLDVVLGEIVSFQPVVEYNQIYLFMIGIVAFLTQLQVLHLLRYHKTIAILGATLARALWDLVSFGVVMGVIFFAFTAAIYFMYHDMPSYSTMSTAMGSQVWKSAYNNFSTDFAVINF